MKQRITVPCFLNYENRKEKVDVKHHHFLTETPTIADIKASANSFLKVSGGVAKILEDNEEVVLGDDELFEKGVWIEFASRFFIHLCYYMLVYFRCNISITSTRNSINNRTTIKLSSIRSL